MEGFEKIMVETVCVGGLLLEVIYLVRDVIHEAMTAVKFDYVKPPLSA